MKIKYFVHFLRAKIKKKHFIMQIHFCKWYKFEDNFKSNVRNEPNLMKSSVVENDSSLTSITDEVSNNELHNVAESNSFEISDEINHIDDNLNFRSVKEILGKLYLTLSSKDCASEQIIQKFVKGMSLS